MHSHHDTETHGTGGSACAVPHTDADGNRVPCPGYPHAPVTDEGVARDVDPVADARRLLADHERGRLEACAQEIGEVLARHGFDLHTPPAQITLVRRGS